MLAPIWSLLGWKAEQPPPSPPPVTITGVRIPVDGTPAHLLSLTTKPASDAMDSFLFHVPDLRQYWATDRAWEFRDLNRLDLLQDHHVPHQHFVQQKQHLQHLLQPRLYPLSQEQRFHLQQRYLLKQEYFILPERFTGCKGAYYMFFSFAADDMPMNEGLPSWIRDVGEVVDSFHRLYPGDVFLVKMAPEEIGENGWAVYEDIGHEFLDCLKEGPLTDRYGRPVKI
ncbi:hypothetical protein V498_00668 [Pseudogymnoascus sp. VKM F-4517 (FW-2822)]|nr:hypothetical protein V498_00668 [Pseudogymnoascus sp. VKM F-4517 (FW-2822)]